VEELNRAIITEWQKLSERFIDSIASVSGGVVLTVL